MTDGLCGACHPSCVASGSAPSPVPPLPAARPPGPSSPAATAHRPAAPSAGRLWYTLFIAFSGGFGMAQPIQLLPVEQYSVEERVELLGRLWDSLLDAGGLPPAPAWHAAEAAGRIARADAAPGSAIPLEQLRRELLGETPCMIRSGGSGHDYSDGSRV